LVDVVSLAIILPITRVIIADISGDQYNMLRLFGLFVCVSLAFVFPLLAYQINYTVVFHAIISTSVFSVIIMALFSRPNFNKKTQNKCLVLVGDDQIVCDREATSEYFCEVESQNGKIVREKLHVCNRHKEVFEERWNDQGRVCVTTEGPV